jgi:hypothetical protein
MTTTVDIRNAIVAKLKAITGIGQVQSFERYANQQSKLKNFYQDEDRILGWVLRRNGFKKTAIADAIYSIRNQWELRGYMSLRDEKQTELAFDALVDLVQLSLTNDPTFGAIASWPENYEMKATLEPVMFCGVLCHSVTITFDSQHEETATIESALNDFLTFNGQYDIEPMEGTAEHAKWLENPANYSTSKPELIDTLNVQE